MKPLFLEQFIQTLDNKLIDDPFYRLNERGVQWVDKEDWIYRTTFDVTPELLAKKNIVLHFERVGYLC